MKKTGEAFGVSSDVSSTPVPMFDPLNVCRVEECQEKDKVSLSTNLQFICFLLFSFMISTMKLVNLGLHLDDGF